MAHTLSRRGLLKGAAAAGVAACTPHTGGDTAGSTPGSTPGKIEHIIMVMMENRSFDHWYGARHLIEGVTDEDGLVAGMSNPSPAGDSIEIFHAEQLCPNDPPHGWDSSRRQFDKGANDGFAIEQGARYDSDGAEVMGYLTRDDLPISYALADAYRTCDRYFCSVMGSTWPNRFFGHMGSSQGVTNNDFPEDSAYTDPSVWAKLDEIGVDWGYYYTDLSYLSLLYQQIDVSRGRLVEEFFEDLEAGQLAPVVWVDPGFSYNDNHPPHHPALGELFLASIHEAIATSSLWDKVLVLVTYDEHGGFFDHVPPPTHADDRADQGFDQLGFRVPTVLFGGYVKPGIDHTLYDHTSWLRWICETHGIEPWNSHIAAADPLSDVVDTDALTAGTPHPPVQLPAFEFDESTLDPQCTTLDLRDKSGLEAIARHMRLLGLPDRLHDRQGLATLFRHLWRRRGLIG
ncbi:MAG: twin-arginine translocation signal domain-containing protein [Oligoflexia bacterium]|nr:twin-arginine translocation signal domain-containing protein [Oligoflexia bacterium]